MITLTKEKTKNIHIYYFSKAISTNNVLLSITTLASKILFNYVLRKRPSKSYKEPVSEFNIIKLDTFVTFRVDKGTIALKHC